MGDDMAKRVRRFNRVVTERVGALNDRFLATGRPLGEARMLWEIRPDSREERSLRADLELGAGRTTPRSARPFTRAERR